MKRNMDSMLDDLMEQVEQVIEGRISNENLPVAKKEMKRIFQQLRLHQLELEMQNDELRTANEELEMQRIKFAGTYDLAPVGYFILDETGVVEEVNTQGLYLLNLTRNLLIKRRFQNFINQEDLENFFNFQKKMLETKKPQSCQLKLQSKNSKSFYAQLEGTAIYNKPGNSTQCNIAVIDISERIEAEIKLADTKERLELALAASAAGTWEIDLKTGYLFLDNSNHEICGLKAGTFDGKYQSFMNLILPDDRKRVDDHFRTSLNSEKEIDIEFRLATSDNRSCYVAARGHMVGSSVRDKRFVGTMTNITEKKLLAEEANKLRLNQQRNITAAILLAQENERRRISEALHDSVSQLLYGIKLNLQQIENTKLNGTYLKKVKSLIDAAINEARTISFELAPSILTDFGLPATIKEMAKRLSTESLSLVVTVDLGERLPLPLEVNIFRILQELINNCIKHSGADTVRIAIKRANNSIQIRVRDNGKGFNVKDKNILSGGSGLSSIKNRLTLYNGKIEVKSEHGKGTTVYISLENINEIL